MTQLLRAAALVPMVMELTPGPASAQSMSPMRAEVVSASDRFAVRVFPGNPYKEKLRFEVKVFDRYFREIPATVRPNVFELKPAQRRPVLILVPFGAERRRKIRICAETTPTTDNAARLRGQVCGRFLGIKRG